MGGFAVEAQGNAAALAMVGFRQVDELEVEGEGAGEQDGALDGQRMDQLQSVRGVAGSLFVIAAGFGVAAADGALAQRFHMGEKVVAGLLAQHLAEQGAERTHIAAQRASFRSPESASSSASRCDQLSGFHKSTIVFRLCTMGRHRKPGICGFCCNVGWNLRG
jgi:hypothetical protein